MELTEKTLEELTEMRSAIASELEKPEANLEELEARASAIKVELERRKQVAAEEAEKRTRIAEGKEGKETEKHMEERKMENEFNRSSAEYRSAWLKNLAVRDGKKLFGELSEIEERAYTHTTSNTGAVVPTEIANRIIELVESMSPMYDDARKSALVSGFGVPRHTGITAGDATSTAEGVANADEENAFDLLPLDGVEIKKHINITRKMQFQSIEAFEDYIINEIGKRIAVAKEKVIIARLNGTAPAGGTAVAGAAIASANVLTGLSYTDATIRSIFAKIKGVGTRVVYANQATIWNSLFGIVDGNNNKIFVPNSMEDPIIAGRIYGAVVKVDENLADDVIYVGTIGGILANDFINYEIETDKSSTSFVTTIGGYSLFDAGLENPKGFVKASF